MRGRRVHDGDAGNTEGEEGTIGEGRNVSKDSDEEDGSSKVKNSPTDASETDTGGTGDEGGGG